MYQAGPPKSDPYQALDMSTDFLTNFMGTVIIMIPVSVVTYWIWFLMDWF